MRVLIAPQEFKGTLTAVQAAQAMAEGVQAVFNEARVELLPMADGGPGTVEAIVAAKQGQLHTAVVSDPLGRPVQAEWGSAGQTAIIEMAAAAGLLRLSREERDPTQTSTYGVGELIRAALDAGYRRLIIGLGGSATNDGGAGMAEALGARFLDATGQPLPRGGAALARLQRIDLSSLDPRLSGCEVIVASDVMSPLCGPEGASLVFGPQKGASPDAVRALDQALRNYAEVLERDTGIRVIDVPGAGAAGGLGAGLIAFLEARIQPGVAVVGRIVGLWERMQTADLVLTGEGRLDGQTAAGKTVFGVAQLARKAGKPVLVIPGSLGPGWEKLLSLVSGVEPVVGAAATEAQALNQPYAMLRATTSRALAGWRRLKELT